MDRFEYVMGLVSIVVGLGLTHILQGIGEIIDRQSARKRPLRLSLAHAIWLVYLFEWMVLFWWWEYRFFALKPEWSIGLYFFLIAYAVSLFLLTVIIVPRNWDEVDDVNEYFLARRKWFYSFFLLLQPLDIVDAYLKSGWSYIVDQGPLAWSLWIGTAVMCLIGMRSTNLKLHSIGGASLLLLSTVEAFVELPRLGF